jgi:hypothetical protein
MDIVLIAYGFRTLANIVIVDLICADLVSWAASSRGMAMMIATQEKVMSYYDQHLEDNFISLVIDIFECLH